MEGRRREWSVVSDQPLAMNCDHRAFVFDRRVHLLSNTLVGALVCVLGSTRLPVVPAAGAGPPPERAPQSGAASREVFRLRLCNAVGGAIELSRDGGASWRVLGRVAQPATAVGKGYRASGWAADGCVAAAAVNALHVKVRQAEDGQCGVIFSVLPRDATDEAVVPSAARMVTDIPAGSGPFGGEGTPAVGCRVGYQRSAISSQPQLSLSGPAAGDYVPQAGDVLTVVGERPVRWPVDCVIENRFGGLITLSYPDDTEVIGTVLKPVVGVGRFGGSLYADVGRIRANHCGVVEVSTSPLGKVGAFQLVPSGHANSPEMSYVRTSTQWLVVGPLDARQPSWEGTPPLFSGYLYPSYSQADVLADDWFDRLTGRFRVTVKTTRQPTWRRMIELGMDPGAPLPEQANTALAEVTHLRIRFPWE